MGEYKLSYTTYDRYPSSGIIPLPGTKPLIDCFQKYNKKRKVKKKNRSAKT